MSGSLYEAPVTVRCADAAETERLRAGAPPQDVGSSAEVLEFEQDLDAEHDPHHFDPSEDIPEEDLAADGKTRRRPPGDHKDRPRLVQFLVAVWAELQRVQWPDRRQVGQATAVVLGFVIVAGAFLGVIDALAKQVVDLIL